MATAAHCLFCFETLAAHLEKRPAPELADIERSYAAFLAAEGAADGDKADDADNSTAAAAAAPPPDEAPLFVTWNTTEDMPPGEHQLRGCIGTFAAQPLAAGLATYALTAALEDTRFAPIARRELPQLQVAVTLLTDFEPAADADDWQLGTHGLRIAFADRRGRRLSATYLPDVAPEQGWTKEQTLVSLMRKAGWTGSRAEWRSVPLQVVRYQGKKRSLDYAAYKRWRDWADKQGGK